MTRLSTIIRLTFVGSLVAVAAAPQDATDGPAILSVERILTGPALADTFRRPAGLCVDTNRGILVIADAGNHRLGIFDTSCRYRGSISFAPQFPGEPHGEPRCVALDASGRFFVVDVLDSIVQVLTPRGSAVGELDVSLDQEPFTDLKPRSIAIGPSGCIYVLCSGSRAGLLVFEPNGKLAARQQFLRPVAETMVEPICVAVNESETELALVDPQSEHQVHVWGIDGRHIVDFGRHGDGEGTFSMAAHVTWGPSDALWVTDTLRHSISVFDSRGRYAGRIGGLGRAPGQFHYPIACEFLQEDRLIVLEKGNGRCQILEVNSRPVYAQAFIQSGDDVTLSPDDIRLQGR